MTDLTQQMIAEYEQFLIDLLEKLKVPEHPYTQVQRFKNRTNIKMSDVIDVEGNEGNRVHLECRMRQLTDQYRRKLD